jgi:methylthioribose-1-phosphate isomerase
VKTLPETKRSHRILCRDGSATCIARIGVNGAPAIMLSTRNTAVVRVTQLHRHTRQNKCLMRMRGSSYLSCVKKAWTELEPRIRIVLDMSCE